MKLKEYYLYRPSWKKFKKRKYHVFFPNSLITFDLIDLQKYKKENNGYAYVVLLLDAFTKKMYVEALKSKHAKNVLNAEVWSSPTSTC